MKINDWNLLKIFYFIASSESFDAAAEKAEINRSGISKHLKRLENEYGQTLVLRNKKTITLTDHGEALYKKITPFYDSIEDIDDDAALNHMEVKKISIATTQGIASSYLPIKLSKFMLENPNTQLNIRTYIENIHESIITNDIAIYPDIQYSKGISRRFIYNVEFGLFCSKQFFEDNKEALLHKDLTSLPLIGFSTERDILFSSTDRFLYSYTDQKISIKDAFRLSISSSAGEILACSEGLGIACIAIKNPLVDKFFLKQLFSKDTIKEKIYIYYKDKDEKNSLIHPLIEYMQNAKQ